MRTFSLGPFRSNVRFERSFSRSSSRAAGYFSPRSNWGILCQIRSIESVACTLMSLACPSSSEVSFVSYDHMNSLNSGAFCPNPTWKKAMVNTIVRRKNIETNPIWNPAYRFIFWCKILNIIRAWRQCWLEVQILTKFCQPTVPLHLAVILKNKLDCVCLDKLEAEQ